MSEYTDIHARIQRIKDAYSALHDRKDLGVTIGTAGLDEGKPGYYVKVGDIIEYRPTIGGALVAVEMAVLDEMDRANEDLRKRTAMRDALAASVKADTIDPFATANTRS